VSTTRFEIPSAVYSWMADGQPVEVTVGEHSIDTTWPWWRPWNLRGSREKPEQSVLPIGLW